MGGFNNEFEILQLFDKYEWKEDKTWIRLSKGKISHKNYLIS